MPNFANTEATWGSTSVTWGHSGLPAPTAPAALYGTRAPTMLSYLPDYYNESTHVRALMQSLGYELDNIWDLAKALPEIGNPATCPAWALPLWEADLGIIGRSSWSVSERRRSITNHLRSCKTISDMEEFVAGEIREPKSAISIGVDEVTNEVLLETPSPLNGLVRADAKSALSKVLPMWVKFRAVDNPPPGPPSPPSTSGSVTPVVQMDTPSNVGSSMAKVGPHIVVLSQDKPDSSAMRLKVSVLKVNLDNTISTVSSARENYSLTSGDRDSAKIYALSTSEFLILMSSKSIVGDVDAAGIVSWRAADGNVVPHSTTGSTTMRSYFGRQGDALGLALDTSSSGAKLAVRSVSDIDGNDNSSDLAFNVNALWSTYSTVTGFGAAFSDGKLRLVDESGVYIYSLTDGAFVVSDEIGSTESFNPSSTIWSGDSFVTVSDVDFSTGSSDGYSHFYRVTLTSGSLSIEAIGTSDNLWESGGTISSGLEFIAPLSDGKCIAISQYSDSANPDRAWSAAIYDYSGLAGEYFDTHFSFTSYASYLSTIGALPVGVGKAVVFLSDTSPKSRSYNKYDLAAWVLEY